MSETTKCGTGCITPSVCHAFFCNRVVQDKVLPSPHPATPPTPDLDAVREAVIELLGYARSPQIARLSESLGLGRYVGKGTERHRVCQRIADALLAAVSRPAEARGEPVAPEMVKVALDEADRDLREGETFASVLAASLNSQMAAPSGGEGERQGVWVNGHLCTLAAPRPEPGEPSKAMVEARGKVLAAVRELRPWDASGLPPRMGSHDYAAAMAKIEAALDAALAAQREQTP